MHGRIREGAQHRWMPLRTEQYNAVRPAARLFYLTATMFAIPVHGYHRYVSASASMRVKAAALMTVAAADGPEMTHGETVTLFNDMCVMAPATLNDTAIIIIPVRPTMNITAQSVWPNARAKVRSSVELGSGLLPGWVCIQIRPNCRGCKPSSTCRSKNSATAWSSNTTEIDVQTCFTK
jgi:hypothetical protein